MKNKIKKTEFFLSIVREQYTYNGSNTYNVIDDAARKRTGLCSHRKTSILTFESNKMPYIAVKITRILAQ